MAKNKGPVYGGKNSRPVGSGGRGRHTGKTGYLGGQHRSNDGCFDVVILLVGVGTSLLAIASYGAIQVVSVIV